MPAKPKQKAARLVTTMRLRPETLEAMRIEAEKRGVSRNLLAEQVMVTFLKKNGHKIKLAPVV